MSRSSTLVKILRQGILTVWILFFVPLPIEAADTTTQVYSGMTTVPFLTNRPVLHYCMGGAPA